MNRSDLEKQLQNWVIEKSQNGIKQHSQRWLDAKVNTIGGSSLATIQGKNPFCTITRLISDKIGFTSFVSDIRPQWGNLFESVIKRYVEHDKRCSVLGEDLFIQGGNGTSYSPDGLAVIDIPSSDGADNPTIVLLEFKCPQVRIPAGKPPDYYIPQVKMGLDMLKLPTIGLFVEGVFRRCSWDHLGHNPECDKTLVARGGGTAPLAYGIIGFYFDEQRYLKKCGDAYQSQVIALWREYENEYTEKGDANNDYIVHDLGESSVALFKLIMSCYDKKIIAPWYGSLVTTQKDEPEILNSDLDKFTTFCRESGHSILGILPWKLFRVDYHFIEREDGYLNPWLAKIAEVLDVVRRCNDPANAAIKNNILESYVCSVGGGFSC